MADRRHDEFLSRLGMGPEHQWNISDPRSSEIDPGSSRASDGYLTPPSTPPEEIDLNLHALMFRARANSAGATSYSYDLTLPLALILTEQIGPDTSEVIKGIIQNKLRELIREILINSDHLTGSTDGYMQGLEIEVLQKVKDLQDLLAAQTTIALVVQNIPALEGDYDYMRRFLKVLEHISKQSRHPIVINIAASEEDRLFLEACWNKPIINPKGYRLCLKSDDNEKIRPRTLYLSYLTDEKVISYTTYSFSGTISSEDMTDKMRDTVEHSDHPLTLEKFNTIKEEILRILAQRGQINSKPAPSDSYAQPLHLIAGIDQLADKLEELSQTLLPWLETPLLALNPTDGASSLDTEEYLRRIDPLQRRHSTGSLATQLGQQGSPVAPSSEYQQPEHVMYPQPKARRLTR